ncbi:MAG TPA: ATP-binding protein [Acidobacteriota bacterium]|nr:ATP-binding protein [Acidobacteriota bacterium]
MSDQERWQKANEDYLAAALHWLRLRLQRLAGPSEDLPAESVARRAKSSRGFFWRKPEKEPRKALPPLEPFSDAALQEALSAMERIGTGDPPPALMILSRRFGLSAFERHTLLLCAALELDTRIGALCALAQHDPSNPHPTFALALSLFDEPLWEALSPERPLRYWRLLEINQPGAQPLTTSPLRADERIVNYIKGLNYLDDRLTPLMVPFEAEAGEAGLPPSQQERVELLVEAVRRTPQEDSPPVLQLAGTDSVSKQLTARQSARELGLHLYRLPVEMLPSQPGEIETLARLWQRESLLIPVALYLDGHEAQSESGGEKPSRSDHAPLQRFLSRSQGVFFLSSREMRSDLGCRSLLVETVKPTPSEQRQAWCEELGDSHPQVPALLSGQFDLNVSAIREIAASVDLAAEEDGLGERLWEACLANTRPALDRLAQRLDCKARWEDIVLPETDLALLHQLAGQVAQRSQVYDQWGFRSKMNRGFGINALFEGESGTGKTMAAEVIANHLRLNLYRIDLSAVVSKYIGETEKNLRRLFDAAENGGALLFFDEADALFGKRSEVKDSHDRYANIEINYLLQRIESYNGLAILATNMKKALDQAFTRRLRFIVNFPFPGQKHREAIWRKVWPEETPTEGLDYARLARFNLTGGSINNIAINAAFAAARSGGPVTMPLVLESAKTEFRKMDRAVNESDFRWSGDQVKAEVA